MEGSDSSASTEGDVAEGLLGQWDGDGDGRLIRL